MSKGNLAEFQKKYGIKRIDFGDVDFGNYDTQYGSDELICPYCEETFNWEGEDTDEVIRGKTFQCPNCEKYFRVEAEVEINTTCTPIEDYIMQNWVRDSITNTYKDDDYLDDMGKEWELNKPYGYCEYNVWTNYAEPLFENIEIDKLQNS